MNPPEEMVNRLLEGYQAGHFDETKLLATTLCREFPKHPLGWKVLGAIFGQSGNHEQALTAHEMAVTLAPQDAVALNNLGITQIELGLMEDAEASCRRAIAIKHDFPDAHANLGNVLRSKGWTKDAEVSYKLAIRYRPNYAVAHGNLGAVLKEQGRLVEAEASFRQAIALNPDFAAAYNSLGNALMDQGKLEKGLESYKKAITVKPDYAEAYKNMGSALNRLGRPREAEASYRQAIALRPNFGAAKHLVASLVGKTTKTAPLDYVEGLFDNYAATFDRSLVEVLEYQAPRIVKEILLKCRESGSLGNIVDLGCGTGLFGQEVVRDCARLEGVDVSEKMLLKARDKGIYDELTKQDIVEFLKNESLAFDYFVATDVFIYVGELSDVFRLIKSRNKAGGQLAFSTEHCGGDSFYLRPSGRYSHSKSYIESLCKAFDYEIRNFEIHTLRRDENRQIEGGFYLLSF